MIRNVVAVKLQPDHDRDLAAGVIAAFGALSTPGMLSYTLGADAGLRESGNWSFAIVADFVDAVAYQLYDRDDEHNRLRDRLRPMAEQIARVQFEM